jgi:DNA modification methylase
MVTQLKEDAGVVLAERIQHWPRTSLVPYERNARTHSAEQVSKIAASIVQFGFVNPILVDGDRGVIAGHGRLRAAELLGMDIVPVVQLGHLTDAQRRAYILADNRLALDAGWDEQLLAEELTTLNEDGFDLALTGFNESEITELFAEEDAAAGSSGDPDAAPALPVTCTTLTGDLWILGPHRLLCGDATSCDHVDRLVGGDRPHCLWTDPPYNVAYVGGTSDALTIKGDQQTPEAFGQFLLAAFTNARAVLRPGASAYVACGEAERVNFGTAFATAGFHLGSCLIWRKSALVLGHSDYHYQHEPILYGWRDDAAHRWFGERTKTTIQELGEPVFQQTGPEEWMLNQGERTLIIRGSKMTVETASGSVFFEEKPARSAEHPTMKPVALVERMLANSTLAGELVLDVFGGSGSTMIACQRLRRRAYLLELDPRYCDVIVRRWQELTGRVALLERTQESFDVRTELARSAAR